MRALIHFTTVHPRGDTRIRVKETASLVEGMGGGVALYVQDGRGAECDEVSGVEIVDTGPPPRGRARRMVLGVWRMYRAVRSARPQVAHFHDPELIPVGLALKLSGIKVVYDVHEDVPRQILGKHWISPWLRRPVAWAAGAFEWLAELVAPDPLPYTVRAPHFAYVGGMTGIRGSREMVEASGRVEFHGWVAFPRSVGP